MANEEKKQVADALKAKKVNYKKRKACIMKKTEEISILCDVKACAITFGANGEIESWPKKQGEVSEIIKMYEDYVHRGDKRKKKKKKMGIKLHESSGDDQKKKKKQGLIDFQSWDDSFLDGLSMGSMQDFLRELDRKLENVSKRREFLKAVNEQSSNINGESINQEQFFSERILTSRTNQEQDAYNFTSLFYNSSEFQTLQKPDEADQQFQLSMFSNFGSGPRTVQEPLDSMFGSHSTVPAQSCPELNSPISISDVEFDHEISSSTWTGLDFDVTSPNLQNSWLGHWAQLVECSSSTPDYLLDPY